jgi:hypothetical protein
LPWLAASIRLSQEAFKLLYLSEISKEGNSCQEKIWDWVQESNKYWWSYPLPTPPSSCGVRIQHWNGRWCPASCALDVEYGGAVGD